MNSIRHMMVGLTRSERDCNLIQYAALIARLFPRLQVRFVHVSPQHRQVAAAAEDDSLQQIQLQVAALFQDVPQSVKTTSEVLQGPLFDRLLAHAVEQEVDLLLVGHRPDHPPGGGALVRRLAMKGPCSVWIVPEGSPLSLSKILVPIDFSPNSADALNVAITLARTAAAECIPLHVYSNNAVLTYEEYEPIARGREEDAYRKFISGLDTNGVTMSPLFVESSSIAKTIHQVAMAYSVDLKVVATRGRSNSAAILLGSVAEGVIIEARTPVLVVKHFGAQLGLLKVLLERAFKPQGATHFD